MEFTAENVEMAVLQFYQSLGGQAEINRWLTNAQISPHAWSFTWQLIQPQKSPEVQFFGANTLHVKIARFWGELSPDQVEPLRSQLLQLISNFAAGPRIVLTRLCIALASFILQTTPQLWSNAVQDLVSMFHRSDSPDLQPGASDAVLLEILTVLPEEFITSQLQPQQRSAVRNELQKGLTTVVPLLHRYLSTAASSSAVSEQALRCFSSWAQFGLPLPDSEPLIALAFVALRSESHFDVTVDALSSVFSHPDNHRFPQSMERLLGHIVQLKDMLQKSVTEHDTETCQSLCRLIVVAADNNTKQIVRLSLGDDQQRLLVMSLIDMLLQCSAVPGHYPVDECCSDFPFGFWYNFQDEIVGSTHEQYLLLFHLYLPVFMQLVNNLLVKVRMPPDNEYSSWNDEVRETHRCYRQDIADTLMYIYSFLVDIMLASLQQLLENLLERSAKEMVPWQEIESVLFAITSIAEGISVEENVHLPVIFTLLTRIPCSNYCLVNQALYLVGAFSEWLSEHPDVIGVVLPLLLKGLHDPSLAQSASMSLKDLVHECQLHLQPYASNILVAAKDVVDSNTLKSREVVRVVTCVGYVLSILPLSDIMTYLTSLLAPHLNQLQQLAAAESSAVVKTSIQFRLLVFSSLFLSLNTDLNRDEDRQDDRLKVPASSASNTSPQPVLLVLQQLLPVLQLILGRWIADSCIVTDVCEILKNAVRTLLSDCASLLNSIASLVVSMYQSHAHPVILDISKQILILFANDAEHEATCRSLFIAVCARTLQVLNTGAQEHTDLLEAFMAFLSQITKKNPALLNDPHCDLSGLFRTAIVGLLMHEMPTVKASCQFLSALLSLGELPMVSQVLMEQGQSLVDALFRAISGESPRANVDPMADVFMALNRNHISILQSCLEAVTTRDGFPTARIVRNDKQQFARKILAIRVNKQKMKEVVNEYTLLWRGLLGTEYAAQTSVLFGR